LIQAPNSLNTIAQERQGLLRPMPHFGAGLPGRLRALALVEKKVWLRDRFELD
jgi:hypothetical protein